MVVVGKKVSDKVEIIIAKDLENLEQDILNLEEKVYSFDIVVLPIQYTSAVEYVRLNLNLGEFRENGYFSCTATNEEQAKKLEKLYDLAQDFYSIHKI